MSNLTKFGGFVLMVAAISLALSLYFRGQKDKALICEVQYSDVSGLTKASPIFFRGYKVGKVTKLRINPKTYKGIIAELRINKNIGFPKNTIAALSPGSSFVSGYVIYLECDRFCKGEDCLVDGDMLAGREVGFVESMLAGNADKYADKAKSSVGELVSDFKAKLTDPKGGNLVADVLKEMDATMSNFKQLETEIKELDRKSARKRTAMKENFEVLSNIMKEGEGQIKAVKEDFATIKKNLDELDTKGLSAHANASVATADRLSSDAKEILQEAKATSAKLNASMAEFSEIMEEAKSGDNSISYIMDKEKMQKEMAEAMSSFDTLGQKLKEKPYLYKPWPLGNSNRRRFYRKKNRK